MTQTPIVVSEGKLCDCINGKFRKDTPEEYVRQNIEKCLVNEHKYEKSALLLNLLFVLARANPAARYLESAMR